MRAWRQIAREEGPVTAVKVIRDDTIRLWRRVKCIERHPYKRIRYLNDELAKVRMAWIWAAAEGRVPDPSGKLAAFSSSERAAYQDGHTDATRLAIEIFTGKKPEW
jgi:hypothetical protein